MPVTMTQPNATPLSGELIASLTRAVAPERAGPAQVVFRGEHSNDVAEVRFDDGRTLMVKRGRYDWVAPRFRSSRLAAELLNHEAGIVAPAPLEIPDELGSVPVEAYWRVELPTLQELWPDLPDAKRRQALRSWGRLVRRVHRVALDGHGPLSDANRADASFAGFLHADLAERLRPAVAGVWPAGTDVVECLMRAVPRMAERLPAERSALLHNDLHMGNVLCETDEGVVRCTGLIDLEAALAGPPEADMANMEVLHGPLFAQPLSGRWFEVVRLGYGAALDEVLMAFFRAYHLLNFGFYSALVGHAEHAAAVAEAAHAETEALR